MAANETDEKKQEKQMSGSFHRIPTRTDEMKLHDKVMREIVDPKRFAAVYKIPEDDAKLKKLNSTQLEDLMRALKVKGRGNQSLVRLPPKDVPGPGEYDLDTRANKGTFGTGKIAPVMRKDYKPGRRFRDRRSEETVPGPGAYDVERNQYSSSRLLRPPACTMHARIPDRVTTGNKRNARPAPGSYAPFPPFGSEGKKFSLYDRSLYKHKSIVQQSPGPGAYMLPSTLKGNVVADWSPRKGGSIQHNSGPVDSMGMAELSERRAYRPGKLKKTKDEEEGNSSPSPSPGRSPRRPKTSG